MFLLVLLTASSQKRADSHKDFALAIQKIDSYNDSNLPIPKTLTVTMIQPFPFKTNVKTKKSKETKGAQLKNQKTHCKNQKKQKNKVSEEMGQTTPAFLRAGLVFLVF